MSVYVLPFDKVLYPAQSPEPREEDLEPDFHAVMPYEEAVQARKDYLADFELSSLRFRMAKALDALSAIQAADVLQAHGHDDLHQHLETAIGTLVGRKD